jgi:EPS-associated MarR family transcriptional regulator
MASRQANLQEDTYIRVMRLPHKNPDITRRELANKPDISVGGLNYCLKALMARGWAKMQNFVRSKNKFGHVYVLTPQGIASKASLTKLFLDRKKHEYEALNAEIKVLSKEIRDDTKGSNGNIRGEQ